MRNGSFSAVLGELDPVSRALLDLSLRRGLRPEEIADVLGTGEDSVVEARDRALVNVADEMGMEGEDRLDQVRALLAELPADEWSGVAPPIAIDEEAEQPEPGEELDAMATAGPDPALLEEAEHELEAEAGAEPPADRLEPPPEFIPRDELPKAEPAPEYVDRDELPRAEEEQASAEAAPSAEAEATAAAVEAPGAEAAEAPAPEPEPAEPEPAPAAREEAPKRRRWRTPILLALLTVLIAVGVLLALLAGGEDDSNPAPSNAGSASTPVAPSGQESKPAAGAAAVRLAPVGIAARGARGTARLTGGGSRLAVSVRGLRDPGRGAYTVWLYNSVIDARSLGSARSGTISLDAKLPEKIARYRFLDISFEPADGNANHSGRSVMRVPTAKLQK